MAPLTSLVDVSGVPDAVYVFNEELLSSPLAWSSPMFSVYSTVDLMVDARDFPCYIYLHRHPHICLSNISYMAIY